MRGHRHSHQFLVLVLAVFLTGSPVIGNPAELVGVAKASGKAEVNGTALPGERNVYSGDRISTQQEATVTLECTSPDKLLLGPNSQVRVDKQGENTVVNLERGVVNFRSTGKTRATLEAYGVEVRTNRGSSAVAQVALLGPNKAQIAALRGSLEVATTSETVTVPEGQAAMLSVQEEDDEDKKKPKGAGAGAGLTRGQKIAITLAVIGGAATAIALPLALDEDKEEVSPAGP